MCFFSHLKHCKTCGGTNSPKTGRILVIIPRAAETGTLSGDLLLCAESGCTSTQSVSVGRQSFSENGGFTKMYNPIYNRFQVVKGF